MKNSSQRRRQANLRVVCVFLCFAATALMVLFVMRLVRQHVANDRKAQVAVEVERQYFEQNFSASRALRDKPSENINDTSRTTVPIVEVLDMSARGPSTRKDRTAAVSQDAPPVETPSPRMVPAPVPKTVGTSGSKVVEPLEQKRTAIEEVLREFFEAGAVAQMLPLVRDARRVRPLMDEYYKRNPLVNRNWKGIGWSIPVEEPGYRFAYVQAIFTNAAPVNVVVEETVAGVLVDWESSVQYSEIGWRDFMRARPAQPKAFRVIASKAQSSDGSTVLSLKHPIEAGLVTGRFDPGDPRFRSLVEQLDLCKWKDVPVILRLCYSDPEASPDEVQIAGVEGKGWLILDDRTPGS